MCRHAGLALLTAAKDGIDVMAAGARYAKDVFVAQLDSHRKMCVYVNMGNA